MPTLQVLTDVGLGMFLQGLSPMENTNPLSIHHRLRRISTSVYDSNNIPDGLGTIGHETLKIDFVHAMLSHESVHVFHTIDWAASSSDCMSHTAMVMTRQYVERHRVAFLCQGQRRCPT